MLALGLVIAVLLLAVALMGAAASWRRRQLGLTAGKDYATATPHRQTPSGYRPETVGNDASARPWERELVQSTHGQPGSAEFHADAFLTTVKEQFMQLQSAWDNANVRLMESLMSPSMMAQIQTALGSDDATLPHQRTEVAMLQAKLLSYEEQTAWQRAAVEFSGMLTEDPSVGPNPFREVWSFVRAPEPDAVWRVNDVQALQ